MDKNNTSTGDGCAIGGLATAVLGIFVLAVPMGIATIALGILALKGNPWAKVLGIIEIIIGAIYIFVYMVYLAM